MHIIASGPTIKANKVDRQVQQLIGTKNITSQVSFSATYPCVEKVGGSTGLLDNLIWWVQAT